MLTLWLLFAYLAWLYSTFQPSLRPSMSLSVIIVTNSSLHCRFDVVAVVLDFFVVFVRTAVETGLLFSSYVVDRAEFDVLVVVDPISCRHWCFQNYRCCWCNNCGGPFGNHCYRYLGVIETLIRIPILGDRHHSHRFCHSRTLANIGPNRFFHCF